MPQSKGRKGRRPSQARRSGAVTGQGTSRGRFGMRAKTWRKVRKWGFFGLAGTVAALIIISFALSSFPGGLHSASGGRTAVVEGVGRSVPITGANHVSEGQTVSYSTTPPTSGSHWLSPASCGVYDTELPDERVVHNMEHGHAIISYNLQDPEEVRRLLEVARSLPELNRWGIVRPYSKIDPGKVAMTAWGVIDEVEGVDEARIRAFYDAYHRNQFSTETSRLGWAIPCT